MKTIWKHKKTIIFRKKRNIKILKFFETQCKQLPNTLNYFLFNLNFNHNFNQTYIKSNQP